MPKPMRTVLFVILVALNSISVAVAESFDDAFDAYNRGDYATALRLFRPLADQGDAASQFGLGVMYDAGRGVTQDSVEAAKWYRRATEQGTIGAIIFLQYLVDYSKNDVEVAKWHRKAADQGIAGAQFTLGIIYRTGRGVPVDYVQAYKWFNLASMNYLASEASAEERAYAIQIRDMVAADMTSAEIAEAQGLVGAWKPTRP